MSTLISELEEPDIPSSVNSQEKFVEPETSTIPVEEESKNAEKLPSNEQNDSKPSTSSALMYSEYMNTSEPGRATKIFERKTKKPVILSYGESPLYRKYSDLLKKLQESKDEYPGGWGKKFPIVKVHLLLQRKHDSDSDDDDDDTEDSSIVICKKKDEDCDDSSSEDSSDDDDEQSISTKPPVRIEVLHETEDSESNDSNKNNSDVNTPISKQESGPTTSFEFIDTCVDSDLTNETDKSEYDHIVKKQRID